MTQIRTNTKLLLRWLIAVLLLIGGQACANMSSSSSLAPEARTITVTFALPSKYLTQYRALADAFQTENTDIRIKLLPTEDILGQGQYPLVSIELAQARQLMTAADTAIMAVHPDITRIGLVQDLGPLIEADKGFHPEDFYQRTLESLQWDGGTWGLPFSADFEVIYYDKETFDATGVAYPQPGWTWDDFLSKATALTRREGDETLRWGFVPILPTPFLLIRGRAAPLVDTATQSVTPLLDRPVVAEALAWLRDLILVHRVVPPPSGEPTAAWTDMRSMVSAGRAAMWSDTSAMWTKWGQGQTVGVAPFPTNQSREPGTGIYLRTYAMSAGTAHPKESWRWLAFLTKQDRARLYTHSVPARRSVAEASGYWEDLEPEMRNTLRYALDHSIPLVAPGLAEVQAALSDALAAVLDGQSPEQVLREAQSRATAQIVQTYGQRPTPVPVIVATPSVEEASHGETRIVFVNARTRRQPTYKKLADAFHELHPEIRVEVRQPDWDAIGGDLSLVPRQGDCAATLTSGLIRWRDSKGTLLSLQPLLDANPDFPLDDFYPQPLEAERRDGQLWALPLEAYPRGIYYNKALFDAADLSYPTLDWTLNDFQTLALALTKGEGSTKQYGYVPGSTGTGEPLFWIQQAGAQLVDDRVTPVRYPFASPTTVAAVQWYANLVRTIGMPDILETTVASMEEAPKLMAEAKAEARSLIYAGRAAMWSEYLGLNPPSKYGFEVGLAPMPQEPGGLSDFAPLGLVISVQATPSAVQACWEWFTFLSAQPTAVDALPARRSVLESAVYRQHVGTEPALLYAAIAARLGHPPVDPFREGEHTQPLFLFIKAYKAIKEGEDAATALGEAERKAQVFAQCMAMAGRKDQETISKCAQEARE